MTEEAAHRRGSALARLRREAQITTAELAEQALVDRSDMRAMEAGAKPVTRPVLRRLARTFDVSEDALRHRLVAGSHARVAA